MCIDQGAFKVEKHQSWKDHLIDGLVFCFITEDRSLAFDHLFQCLHLIEVVHNLQIGNHLQSFGQELPMKTFTGDASDRRSITALFIDNFLRLR